jgi:hypothetical protein
LNFFPARRCFAALNILTTLYCPLCGHNWGFLSVRLLFSIICFALFSLSLSLFFLSSASSNSTPSHFICSFVSAEKKLTVEVQRPKFYTLSIRQDNLSQCAFALMKVLFFPPRYTVLKFIFATNKNCNRSHKFLFSSMKLESDFDQRSRTSFAIVLAVGNGR